MFEVMAAISLIVAFAALWLASDARKHLDVLTHEFVHTHIKGVRNKVTESNRKINELSAQLGKLKLAKTLKAFEAAQAQDQKSLSAMIAELHKLRDELDRLDQSIPPKYRLRVHAAQSQ